jgi:hypothetical protein
MIIPQAMNPTHQAPTHCGSRGVRVVAGRKKRHSQEKLVF